MRHPRLPLAPRPPPRVPAVLSRLPRESPPRGPGRALTGASRRAARGPGPRAAPSPPCRRLTATPHPPPSCPRPRARPARGTLGPRRLPGPHRAAAALSPLPRPSAAPAGSASGSGNGAVLLRCRAGYRYISLTAGRYLPAGLQLPAHPAAERASGRPRLGNYSSRRAPQWRTASGRPQLGTTTPIVPRGFVPAPAGRGFHSAAWRQRRGECGSSGSRCHRRYRAGAEH